MGLREFSMHPAQLLAVKQEILNSDLSAITYRRHWDPGSRLFRIY
jgi:phosphotransferase system enzyme I (PtsI)